MTPSDIIERAPVALQAAIAALRDPASDPLTALLSIAAIVVVLLIIILVVLLVIQSRPHQASQETPSQERREPLSRPGHSRRSRTFTLAIAVPLLAAAVIGWQYSTSDGACSSCHFTTTAVASHGEGRHATVECRDCHVGPGIVNGVLMRMEGVSNLAAQLTGISYGEQSQTAIIRNESCLRCHRDVQEGVVTARSVRMRHSDVVALDALCVDCHNTAGHGDNVRRARHPEMAQCVLCHDGEAVSALCETCHSGDVALASRKPSDLYAKAHVPTDSCRGCHPMEPCIACHGIELPHSQAFMDGYHARKGLLEPETCIKCHSPARFCNGCHNFPVKSNGTLGSAHGSALGPGATHPPADGTSVCSCHELEPQKFCDYCHGSQPSR